MQGVQRRSKQLLAWLSRHQDQLRLWGDDLPKTMHATLANRRSPADAGDEFQLLTLVQPTVATILTQHCGALVSLKLWLPDPPAGSGSAAVAAGSSPLEGHSALTRLLLKNFRGSAGDLTVLLEPASRLSQLELVVEDVHMHPQLLVGVQAHPLLCRLLAGLSYKLPYHQQGVLEQPVPQGLVGCTALTRLALRLTRHTWTDNVPTSADLPPEFSNLRWAAWSSPSVFCAFLSA